MVDLSPPGTKTHGKRTKDNEPNWAPYCLMCDTMGRMTETATGFVCLGRGDHFGRVGCGNRITWDLVHVGQPTSSPGTTPTIGSSRSRGCRAAEPCGLSSLL